MVYKQRYNNGNRYWINRVGSLICYCGYRLETITI